MDKATYQGLIRLLARMCAKPLAFTIDALTAEGDRVVAEARSEGLLIDGQPYGNTYVFVFKVQGGRIAWIAEHYNALIITEKLIPVMKLLEVRDAAR
jgi:ketosteroid isomerase-like protein